MDSYGWDVLQESERFSLSSNKWCLGCTQAQPSSTPFGTASTPSFEMRGWCRIERDEKECGQVGKQKMTKDDGFFHFTLASCL